MTSESRFSRFSCIDLNHGSKVRQGFGRRTMWAQEIEHYIYFFVMKLISIHILKNYDQSVDVMKFL